MFRAPKPERYINAATNRPHNPQDNALFPPVLIRGSDWRNVYPQYVDANGLLTSLTGAALDEAINNKTVITGNEWRELNKNKKVHYINALKERDFYIDSLTALPPIDPRTGELLVITDAIAVEKIVSGEWITVKQFVSKTGEIEFINKITKVPTILTGSALFAAIARGEVYGHCVKQFKGTRKNSRDSLPEELPIDPSFYAKDPVGRLLSEVEGELRRKRPCTPTLPEQPPLPSPPLSLYHRHPSSIFTPPGTPNLSSSSYESSSDNVALDELKKLVGLDLNKSSSDKIDAPDKSNLDKGPTP